MDEGIFVYNMGRISSPTLFVVESKTINYAAIFPDGYGISVIISGTPFDTDINKNEENTRRGWECC